MNKELFVALVILASVVCDQAQSCNSCGPECKAACGTRSFRTCCFNYMKKRSDNSEPLPIALDPSLRLELWLAKSRLPYFQHYNNAFDASSMEIPNDMNINKNRDLN